MLKTVSSDSGKRSVDAGAITVDDAIEQGLVTETDIDVGLFAQKHNIPAVAVTDMLELIQRAATRSVDEEEPFALNYVALKSRLSRVAGFTQGLQSAARTSTGGLTAVAENALRRERKLKQEAMAVQKATAREHELLKQYNSQVMPCELSLLMDRCTQWLCAGASGSCVRTSPAPR